MVLRWYNTGAALVLRWRSGATHVLHWCQMLIALALHWSLSGTTLALQWHCDDTALAKVLRRRAAIRVGTGIGNAHQAKYSTRLEKCRAQSHLSMFQMHSLCAGTKSYAGISPRSDCRSWAIRRHRAPLQQAEACAGDSRCRRTCPDHPCAAPRDLLPTAAPPAPLRRTTQFLY